MVVKFWVGFGIPRRDAASATLASDGIHLNEKLIPVAISRAVTFLQTDASPAFEDRPFASASTTLILSNNMSTFFPWLRVSKAARLAAATAA